MNNFFRSSINIAALLLLTACGGSRENDPPPATEDSLNLALSEVVDQTIIPAVDAFYSDSRVFDSAAAEFCVALDAAGLTALQSHWRGLSESWFRLLPYNFGPLDDDLIFPPYSFIDSYRPRGRAYTETVREQIAAWVSGSMILNTAYFSEQPFNKMGLLAVEIALFETIDTQSQSRADIVDEFQSNGRKCETLVGLSKQLVLRAQSISEGWHIVFQGKGASYRSLFLGNQLEDGSESLATLITAVQQYLDYLSKRHVVSASAAIADYAWPSVSAAVDSIEAMLQGTEKSSLSFFALMKAGGYEASVETVENNFKMIRSSIVFEDALQFEVAISQLDGSFKREIPNGLEVELGVNFTDGD